MLPINTIVNRQCPSIDIPRRNRSVGKDVLALGEQRADRRGKVGEPLLSAAVALVHRREVLHPSRNRSVPVPNFPSPDHPSAQAAEIARTS